MEHRIQTILQPTQIIKRRPQLGRLEMWQGMGLYRSLVSQKGTHGLELQDGNHDESTNETLL